MALTPQQEQILIAIGNAFLSAGINSEELATQALTHLKLQNDITQATAQLDNLKDDYDDARSAKEGDLNDAQAAFNDWVASQNK